MTILLFGSTVDICNGQEEDANPQIRRKRVVPIISIDMGDAVDTRPREPGVMIDSITRMLRTWRHEGGSTMHLPKGKNIYAGITIDTHKHDSDRGSSEVIEEMNLRQFKDSSLSFSAFSMDFSIQDINMSMSMPSVPTPKPPSSTPPVSPPDRIPTNAPEKETPEPSLPQVTDPTGLPEPSPTDPPVAEPTDPPISAPTDTPVATPTDAPVAAPTDIPVAAPTDVPLAAPTDAPTVATTVPLPPFADCATLPRDEALQKILAEITDLSFLNDISVAQGKAVDWLLNSDPAEIDPCTFPTVVQRYGLATLYYSTNGDGWTNNSGWLSGANECMWTGISCETDKVNEILLGKYQNCTLLEKIGPTFLKRLCSHISFGRLWKTNSRQRALG
jgi:hypothetical protein